MPSDVYKNYYEPKVKAEQQKYDVAHNSNNYRPAWAYPTITNVAKTPTKEVDISNSSAPTPETPSQYDIQAAAYFSLGNMLSGISSEGIILAETGKVWTPYALKIEAIELQACRPSGIAANVWANRIATSTASEEALSLWTNNGIAKLSKGLPVAAVAIDVGIGVYDNVQEDAPVEKIVTDAGVDVAFDATGIWTSTTLGCIAGSEFPVAGNIVGAVVGLIVGVTYTALVDTKIDGKSIKDRTKEGVNDFGVSYGKGLEIAYTYDVYYAFR